MVQPFEGRSMTLRWVVEDFYFIREIYAKASRQDWKYFSLWAGI